MVKDSGITAKGDFVVMPVQKGGPEQIRAINEQLYFLNRKDVYMGYRGRFVYDSNENAIIFEILEKAPAEG